MEFASANCSKGLSASAQNSVTQYVPSLGRTGSVDARVKRAAVIEDPILLRICHLVEPSPLGTHAFDFWNGLDLQWPSLILIGVEEAIEERLDRGANVLRDRGLR